MNCGSDLLGRVDVLEDRDRQRQDGQGSGAYGSRPETDQHRHSLLIPDSPGPWARRSTPTYPDYVILRVLGVNRESVGVATLQHLVDVVEPETQSLEFKASVQDNDAIAHDITASWKQ